MLDFFLSSLLVWNYALLFLVVSFASFGFPLPATALLMASGAFSAQGYFEMDAILLSALAAAIIGDHAGYFASLKFGRPLFSKIGFKTVLESKKFANVEALFTKHSSWTILASRFLATGLGPAVNLLSGFTKVSKRKFFALDVVGETLYVLIFASLGYVFGDQWEAISSIASDLSSILLILFVAIGATAAIRYHGKKKRLFG